MKNASTITAFVISFLVVGSLALVFLFLGNREAEPALSLIHIFPLIFKASYDKANRTSITSFRGPGVREGCRSLSENRQRAGTARRYGRAYGPGSGDCR